MQFDAFVPTRLVFGAGRLAEAGTLARSLGRRALIVTSRSAMARLGYTGRLQESLTAAGLQSSVFQDLGPAPTTDNVDRAADLAREFHADLIIGMGGGSALDCAKAVAGVAPGRMTSADYLHGRAPIGPETLPLLAIPTTSGTGSEMNRSAILVDPGQCQKDGIRSDFLFPRVALVDPRLTYDMPTAVTAQTGFDTLTHAVESYVSAKSQPLADVLALDAMATVITELPLVLTQPGHEIGRAHV